MNPESLEDPKSSNILFSILVAIITLPAAVLIVVPLYQLLRAAYCHSFVESQSSVSTMWCRFIGYDFRPDLMLLVLLTIVIYPIAFSIKNRAKTASKLRFISFALYILAIFGLVLRLVLSAKFGEAPWW